MKLTFEGETFREIMGQISQMISEHIAFGMLPAPQSSSPEIRAEDIGLADKPVEKPVHKPVDKPVETSGAEKARKMREAKAAKASKPKPVEPVEEPPAEQPAKAPITDVNEIIKIRQRTINDLQEAYANGHQQQVFELLSRFGNGAKSFRELTAESFLPIREAIDAGALK